MPKEKENLQAVISQLKLFAATLQGSKAAQIKDLILRLQEQGRDLDAMVEITPAQKIEVEYELIRLSSDNKEIAERLMTINDIAMRNIGDFSTLRAAYSAIYSLAILGKGGNTMDAIESIAKIAEVAAKAQGDYEDIVSKSIMVMQSIAIAGHEEAVTTAAKKQILTLGQLLVSPVVKAQNEIFAKALKADFSDGYINQLADSVIADKAQSSVFHAMKCLAELSVRNPRANAAAAINNIYHLALFCRDMMGEALHLIGYVGTSSDNEDAKRAALDCIVTITDECSDLKEAASPFIDALAEYLPQDDPGEVVDDKDEEPTDAERISRLFEEAINKDEIPDSPCYKIIRICTDNADNADIILLAIEKLRTIAVKHDKADAKMIMKYIGTLALQSSDKAVINEALQAIGIIAVKKEETASKAIDLAYQIGDKKTECKESAISLLQNIKTNYPSTSEDVDKAIRNLGSDAPGTSEDDDYQTIQY